MKSLYLFFVYSFLSISPSFVAAREVSTLGITLLAKALVKKTVPVQNVAQEAVQKTAHVSVEKAAVVASGSFLARLLGVAEHSMPAGLSEFLSLFELFSALQHVHSFAKRSIKLLMKMLNKKGAQSKE